MCVMSSSRGCSPFTDGPRVQATWPLSITRRVHIVGITPQLRGGWIKQISRNVTDPMHGFPLGNQYLIMDRDAIFTQSFAAT